MIFKYRTLFLLISISLYLLIFLFGDALVPTRALDSQVIAGLEVEAGEVSLGSSYAVMALIYQFLPNYLIPGVTILFGILFIYYTYRDAKYKNNIFILFVLLFIPMLLTISVFQKDLLLVAFIVFNCHIITSKLKFYKKIFFVSFSYLIYGLIFRQYYFLITLIFLYFIFLFRLPFFYKFFLTGCGLFLLFLLPNEVYYSLQSSRDLVNQNRLNGGVGYRTVFLNLKKPDSSLNFIINYIYAFLRLNFGILFNYTIKDLLFCFYPLFYIFNCLKSFKFRSEVSLIAALLIISHIFVYILFEPDTGSYARHLSSTLPYLAIILSSFYNKNSKKTTSIV